MQNNIPKVVTKLEWMKEKKIWPNGLRYLWTDAFGVVNLLSLYKELGDQKYLEEADRLVKDVYRVLGRQKGLRIGEESDRDGQYYHYLAKWMYALNEYGKIDSSYHEKAVQLVKDIHPRFLIKGRGVWWKMEEDLSAPYRGYGLGGLDFYSGYVMYKLIDPVALSSEINDMKQIIDKNYRSFSCSQDLGLGEMLWHTHFFPEEDWAKSVTKTCVETLDEMWNPKGYFMRDHDYERDFILAFGNFGVSVGLQSHNLWPERVNKLNTFFETFRSRDKYDFEAITHVMNCSSYFPGLFVKDYKGKI